ncbi:RidA family protein [Kineosporia succinea]|uniref:Enamine deaminase RidA (YjgF/YER057c/UK114 family) n=1 Tax=Kineosporia succinea TaxID=84632 RepID=A0ABT9NYP1_9ACTN|nr:RidA family protein [Kineosporia succinea]MDP9825562.1 enamine deaminase RidA (YjgF/YER057c/UK114 family) [Kineosporia succinea]
MDAITFVRPAELAPDVPYAYASVVDRGRLIFTAGACPIDQHDQIVAPGDVAAQTAQVMANLTAALAASGAGLSDVLKTTVYVASSRREDLVAAWDVVHDAFGDHDAPSTLLGVSVLGYEHQLVEVEAVAAVDPPSPR